MSHSILLVFEEPVYGDAISNTGAWTCLSQYAKGAAKQDKAIQVLSKNVVVIEIGTTLDSLQECLSHTKGLRYKYAIFPDGIEWHQPI